MSIIRDKIQHQAADQVMGSYWYFVSDLLSWQGRNVWWMDQCDLLHYVVCVIMDIATITMVGRTLITSGINPLNIVHIVCTIQWSVHWCRQHTLMYQKPVQETCTRNAHEKYDTSSSQFLAPKQLSGQSCCMVRITCQCHSYFYGIELCSIACKILAQEQICTSINQ